MSDPAALHEILKSPAIWQGRRRRSVDGLRSGHPALDRALPTGGWPRGALTELLPAATGIGELRLLLPALTRLARLCWVDPPHIPYPPALAAAGLDLKQQLILRPATPADALWAMEQVLRAGAFAAVLAWAGRLDMRSLRRLQLAAEDSGSLLFLFRPARCAADASPAALRLALRADGAGLAIRILKCRGGRPGDIHLNPSPDAVAGPALSPPAAGRARRRDAA